MPILLLLAVLGQFPSFQPATAFPSFTPPAIAVPVIVEPAAVETPPARSAVELIAFSAAWCGPCRRMVPTLAAIEAEGVRVHHIDIDRYPEYSRRWRVSAVPTTIVVSGGKEVARHVGLVPLESLQRLTRFE